MRNGLRVIPNIILLTLLVSACSAGTPSPSLGTSTPGVPWLKITETMDLHASPNVDAPIIDTLSAGMVLRPANSAGKYDCVLVKEIDPEHSLCHVEVVETGETGWVIAEWESMEAVVP